MSTRWRIMLGGAAMLLVVLVVTAAAALAVLGTDAVHLRAVAFAAAVTGGGAVAGWIAGRQGRGGPAGVAGGLAATLVRMMPLLVALAWLTGRDDLPWAREAGGLLVAFHLALLVADMTLNSLADRRTDAAPGRAKTRPPASADVVN